MRAKLVFTFITFLSLPLNDFLLSTSDPYKYSKEVITNADPLVFEIYNDKLFESEITQIDIQSPNFEEFVAFQFSFDLNNSTFLSISSNVLNENDLSYYWNEENNNLGVIWLSGNGEAISIPNNEVLFSIEIMPLIDINVKDIFTLNEESIVAEAVPNSLEEVSILLLFEFLERNTSTTNTENYSPLKIFPNHLMLGKSKVKVEGAKIIQASLYDFNGKLIRNNLSFSKDEISLDFGHKGMYVLKIFDGKEYHSEILTVHI